MPKITLGVTRFHESLGRDQEVEEPSWGPSFNLVTPKSHYSVSRDGSVQGLFLSRNRTSCFRLVLKTSAFNSILFQRPWPVSIIKCFDCGVSR